MPTGQWFEFHKNIFFPKHSVGSDPSKGSDETTLNGSAYFRSHVCLFILFSSSGWGDDKTYIHIIIEKSLNCCRSQDWTAP